MYEARAICNLLIAEWRSGQPILTNLRINKILYFIQLWSLRQESGGVIRNHFEAWPLGPVIKSVYEEFLIYGDERIKDRVKYFDYSLGTQNYISFDRIQEKHRALVRNVNGHYFSHSTLDLVELSHNPNGPWAHVWSQRPRGTKVAGRIPNDLMRAYLVGQGCVKPNQ